MVCSQLQKYFQEIDFDLKMHWQNHQWNLLQILSITKVNRNVDRGFYWCQNLSTYIHTNDRLKVNRYQKAPFGPLRIRTRKIGPKIYQDCFISNRAPIIHLKEPCKGFKCETTTLLLQIPCLHLAFLDLNFC